MDEKTYKFYIFYLNTEDEVYGVQPSEIYAYTNKKKYAKEFINSRISSNFRMKIVKLDRDEMNTLYNEHMLKILEPVDMLTRYSDSVDRKTVRIIVTRQEHMTCDNQASLYLHEYLYRDVFTSPIIFKKKYIKALTKILYSGLHYFVHGIDDIYMKTAERVSPNIVNILLDNFGELFKEEGDD